MRKFTLTIIVLNLLLCAQSWAVATAPVFTSQPDPTKAAPQQTFTWTVAEGESYQCKLDTNDVTCGTGTYTTNSGLADGTHQFTIRRSTDSGATWSEWTSASFLIGQVVPEFLSQPFSGVALPTQTITWFPKTGSTYQCKLDNVLVTCGNGSYTTAVDLASGTHQFALRQSPDSGTTWSDWAQSSPFQTAPITSDTQIAKLLGNLAKQMWTNNFQVRFRNRYGGMYVRKSLLAQCGDKLTLATDPQVLFEIRQAYLTAVWGGVLAPLLAHHAALLDQMKAMPLAVSASKKTLVAQTIQNEQTMHDQLADEAVGTYDLCNSLTLWGTSNWLVGSRPALFTAWWPKHVTAYRTAQWMPAPQYTNIRKWLFDAGFNATDIKSFTRHGWKWQAKSVIDDWSKIDSLLKTAMLDRQNMNAYHPAKFESHVDTPPASLTKYDLLEGTGTRTVQANDTVQIKYSAAHYTNGEVFDSTWTLGSPLQFQLGKGKVVAGVDQGIIGMKPGGRRQLVVPPSLAYGATGTPPIVGPNETIVYMVDLVKIK